MKQKRKQESDWFVREILPHERDLRGWLISRFPTCTDLDDVIQESFFKLLRARSSGPIVNPRAYLFTTAKNTILSRFRHSKVEHPSGVKALDPLSIVDEMRSPVEETVISDEVQMLLEALESLPRRCCQVMTLRKIYGLSVREVAEKLGITVSTVQNQYSIGLEKCAVYFRKKGYRRLRK